MNKTVKAREINKLSREEQTQQILDHPHWIKYLDEQDDYLCELAIDKNPRVLCLIRNQTEDFCIRSIIQDYTVIAYVRNLTDRVVQAALDTNNDAIYYLPEEWYKKYK